MTNDDPRDSDEPEYDSPNVRPYTTKHLADPRPSDTDSSSVCECGETKDPEDAKCSACSDPRCRESDAKRGPYERRAIRLWLPFFADRQRLVERAELAEQELHFLKNRKLDPEAAKREMAHAELLLENHRLVERDHAGIKRVLYLEGRLERAEALLWSTENHLTGQPAWEPIEEFLLGKPSRKCGRVGPDGEDCQLDEPCPLHVAFLSDSPTSTQQEGFTVIDDGPHDWPKRDTSTQQGQEE